MTERAVDAARDLKPTISALVADASPDEPLSDEIVGLLVDADLHAVMTPRDVGGLELSLVDCLDVFTELSWADGSTGWCAMANAATIGFFGAWAGDSFADELFADGVPLAAGQFAPNGTSTPDGDGYVVTGDYQFGSGVNHSSWVGAGTLTVAPEGEDTTILFALMPRDRVRLMGNWDVLGLERTASYDYEVRDVYVPADATFDFFAPVRRRGGPVYDLGVLPLTAVGHAGFALGTTRRAIDELVDIATTKERLGASAPMRDQERFLIQLADLESRWRATDAWLRGAAAEAEQSTAEGPADLTKATALRQATVFATQEGADIARCAYRLSGTSGLRDGPLSQAFRDLHAGTQHFFAGEAASIDMGRDIMDAGEAT